jgi:hypothetical protein
MTCLANWKRDQIRVLDGAPAAWYSELPVSSGHHAPRNRNPEIRLKHKVGILVTGGSDAQDSWLKTLSTHGIRVSEVL